MRALRSIVTMLMAALCWPALSADDPILSDLEAANLVQESWSNNFLSIATGALSVAQPGIKRDRGVPQDLFDRVYGSLAQSGYIEIIQSTSEESPPPGVVKTVVVSVTSRAREIGRRFDADMWSFRLGTASEVEVVSNDAIEGLIQHLRLLKVTYDVDWTPPARMVYRVCDKAATREQKAIMLFAFDDFGSSWALIAQDTANEADSFCTDFVTRALKENQ